MDSGAANKGLRYSLDANKCLTKNTQAQGCNIIYLFYMNSN